MASTVDIYGSKSALPSSATNGTIALVTGSDLTPGGSPSGRAAANIRLRHRALAVGHVLTTRRVLANALVHPPALRPNPRVDFARTPARKPGERAHDG